MFASSKSGSTSLSAPAPGSRVSVRGQEWLVSGATPIETGGYAVQVLGISELVRGKKAIFLDKLDSIVEVRPEDTRFVLDGTTQYRRSRLYLEALLRRTPPTDDKIHIGHRGAFDKTNYQLVPAQLALDSLRPSILIADGVGVGKTLEVGILLADLIKRGRGERILVVALKSLLGQFQQELWNRFSIPLVRLDSEGIARVKANIPANKNPFHYYNRCIVSIDTLKNDGRYRTYLEQCRWDVVIIDECHHVANDGNQRSRLATLLARTTDSMILTSATPHNGKPESFANLMNMLDPTAVADPANYTAEDISGLFVRRFKKDIQQEATGDFMERSTEVVPVEATSLEASLLKNIGKMTFRTLERKSKRGGDLLFRHTLLKSFLSSPQACLETVMNRIDTIERTSAKSQLKAAELRDDHAKLDMVRSQLEVIADQGYSKLDALGAKLRSFGWTGKKNSPRVIVFSERIRTLGVLKEYLLKEFRVPEAAVQMFHAGLQDTEQMGIVEDFGKEDSTVRVLLASDVASEGVNLHFYCNHLIHFDIPWSPITLEQRNGRIDRYGQSKTPHIVYLLTTVDDPKVTSDLRVYRRLIEKEEAIQKNLGDPGSLMGLYDPGEEEEEIQARLALGKPVEEIVPDEPEEPDFLAMLLAAVEGGGATTVEPAKDPTLYPSDLKFCEDAFEEVLDPDDRPEIEDDHVSFFAPPDLKRFCDFIPREAWPKDWEFSLSPDRSRIQMEIASARKRSKKEEDSGWPRVQLLWELHPVFQWLLDKTLVQFGKNEAPAISVRGLDKATDFYLFQGTLSNLRGQPSVVEWFAVPVKEGQAQPPISLDEFLGLTRFDKGIDNVSGSHIDLIRLESMREAVVRAAEDHMRRRRQDRIAENAPRLKEDERRFDRWKSLSLQQVTQKENRARDSKSGEIRRDLKEKYARDRNEIHKRYQARKDWVAKGLDIVDRPYLRLAAVFVGS